MGRHGREDFFIEGEGFAGGGFHAMSTEAEMRAFRFQRVGPKGRQLGLGNLERIARAMTKERRPTESKVPAGYTYLGQFIDHDLTFDKTDLSDGTRVNVDELLQSRSPSLDLDSLYGLGPRKDRRFYSDGVKLKVGNAENRRCHDLPRERRAVTPLIPDGRNDENLAVAQTHLAFIHFHNRMVDRWKRKGLRGGALFEKARDEVIRHYQWMIRTDFLPRLVDKRIVDGVFRRGRKVVDPDPAPGQMPAMPVEFSVAAYRMGHSMVRPAYDWNAVFFDQSGILELLFDFSSSGSAIAPGDGLSNVWPADFRRLYNFAEAKHLKPALRRKLQVFDGRRNRLNFAQRINTSLADPLSLLPLGPPNSGIELNLAFRNLNRARMMRLASGQQMADLMQSKGVPIRPLTNAQILRGKGGASLSALTATQRRAFLRDTPLWFYVLRESELRGGKLNGVGGRLVAETFHRCVEGSSVSILDDSGWAPSVGPNAKTFRMVDLLLFAHNRSVRKLAPLGD